MELFSDVMPIPPQMVKLLSVEKGKKGKSLVNFLVGDRVRRYLESCHRREKTLTDILRGGPDDHADLVRLRFPIKHSHLFPFLYA